MSKIQNTIANHCIYCGNKLSKEDMEHGQDTCSLYCFNITYVCDVPGADACSVYADLLNYQPED